MVEVIWCNQPVTTWLIHAPPRKWGTSVSLSFLQVGLSEVAVVMSAVVSGSPYS